MALKVVMECFPFFVSPLVSADGPQAFLHGKIGVLNIAGDSDSLLSP